MCICKEPKSAKSACRRRTPQKPRLSRKIIPGARVNLNVYWADFEVSMVKRVDDEIDENLANEIKELAN